MDRRMGRRMRKRNIWKGRLRYEDGVEMGKKGAMPEPGFVSALGRLVMMMMNSAHLGLYIVNISPSMVRAAVSAV